MLESPLGDRVALVTIDLHGGSRYITEQAAALLADEGFHPANLFLCGTHNHAGPGGLYASPYFDGFAASTGIFSGFTLRVGFNQTLADVLAARVEKAVREAIKGLRAARLGSSHDVRLKRWSRQRSGPAVLANFPGHTIGEVVERFRDIGGGDHKVEGIERWALDARLQTIAAFSTGSRLIGSFTTWGAHCAMMSREHQVQSADYFGQAASLAEEKHPGAVVAVAAGAIGDADPLPPNLNFKELLEQRSRRDANFELIDQQARGLAGGLLEAITAASKHQSNLMSLSSRLLEDRISEAEVGGVLLPRLPRVGIPTLAGSELGTGDIWVGVMVHLNEGVCAGEPDDGPHWAKTESNWTDKTSCLPERTVGHYAGMLAFRVSRPFLDAQQGMLPVRYLELQLDDRKLSVIGLPGEPTTWLAAQLAELAPTGARTLVAGVTGEYAGYLTTELEYGLQHYEGGSTIWGRYTERWLSSKIKALVSGKGSERSVEPPPFKVLREGWITRMQSDDYGEMTWR